MKVNLNHPVIENALRFSLAVLRDELRSQSAHFDNLDRLYSEFFRLQNQAVRCRHKYSEISKEERDRLWRQVDAQEAEWQARLDDWLSDKFSLIKSIEKIQQYLRNLSEKGVEDVAA